jgi:hypothetical protein
MKNRTDYVKEQVMATYLNLEKIYPFIPFDSEVGKGILTGAMWNILGQSGSKTYWRNSQRDNPEFLRQETSDYITSQFNIVNKLMAGNTSNPLEISPVKSAPTETAVVEKAAAQAPRPPIGIESNYSPNRTNANLRAQQPNPEAQSPEFKYDIDDFQAGQPNAERFYLPENAAALPLRTIEKTYKIPGKEVSKALELGYVDKIFSNPRKERADMQWNRLNVEWLKDTVTEAYDKAAKEYPTFAYDPETSNKIMSGTMSYILSRSGAPFFADGLRSEKSFMRRQAAIYIGGRLSLLERIQALGDDSNSNDSGSPASK